MLHAIKNTLTELKNRFKTMPVIYITILFLASVIFFNQDIPESFMPIILLSSTVIFFLSDYVANLSKTKKWVVMFLAYTFISLLHYIFISTYNSLVEQSALSLMYLYLFFSINLYLSSSKNYILEMKAKVIHVLISFAIFVAMYLCLYFSTFFIYTIFSEPFNFFYNDNYASRIINSITTIIFFSILSIYKRKEYYTSSKFFNVVFSRLVPVMLVFFLSLAIIYFSKLVITCDSKMDFIEINYTAPILTFLIFLSLVMVQITDNVKKILKVLFILSIITSIMMAIFYLRYAKLSSSIHFLLIYLLLASYFLITLLKTNGITYLASYVISLIIFIYFIPVIGQINYEKFISEEDRSMSKNNMIAYQERKEKKSNKKEASESFYYHAPDSSKKVRLIIKNENYSDILIDVCVRSKDYEDEHFTYKNYEFSLSKDGKKIIIKNMDKDSIEEFDLYTVARNKKKDEIIEFDSLNFKLVLSSYTFNEYSKSINFNVYFYNN